MLFERGHGCVRPNATQPAPACESADEILNRGSVVSHPLTALVVAALALFGLQTARAGDEACFCYQDPETEAVLVGCQEIKGPNDAFPRTSCRDPVGGGYREVSVGLDWVRIGADEDACRSCAPRVLPGADRPRGDGAGDD